MKTLQELKDEVSRKWTSKNFDDISSDDARVNMAFKVTILGEAAELYASQFQEQLSALQQDNNRLKAVAVAAESLCAVIHKQSMVTWTTPEYIALEKVLPICTSNQR